MAIVFSTDISETVLLDAYTNNVVEFASDSMTPGEAFKCEIRIGASSFEITPNAAGFFFNFKTVFKKMFAGGFEDAPAPALDENDLTTFVLDMSEVYRAVTLAFTISFTDGATESAQRNVKLLQAVSNFQDFKRDEIQATDSFAVLRRPVEGSARTFEATYFEGYPFDVQVYKSAPGNVTITNVTNGLDVTLNLPNKVNRIFLSDTETDSTLLDVLPLVEGVNELEFDTGDLTTIFLERRTSCNGRYLKWKNDRGGWSYWLFERKDRTERDIDDLGYVNNDFRNLDNNNFIKNIGKSGTDTVNMGSINVPPSKRRFFESLFDSPKVYLFTGTDYSDSSASDWLAVKVLTENYIVDDYNDRPFDLVVDIELPRRNSLTL